MYSKLVCWVFFIVSFCGVRTVHAQKEEEKSRNTVYVVEKSKFKDPPASGSPDKYKKMTVEELTTHHFGQSGAVAYSEAYFRGAKRSAVFNAEIKYPPTKSEREAIERELRRLYPQEKQEVADSRAELQRRFREFKKVAVLQDTLLTQSRDRLNRMEGIIQDLHDFQWDLFSIRNIADLRSKIEFILTRLQEFDKLRKEHRELKGKDWLVYSVTPEDLFAFHLWEDYDVFEIVPDAPEVNLNAVIDHLLLPELSSLMMALVQGHKIRLSGNIESERQRIIAIIDGFKYEADAKNVDEFRYVLIQMVLMMGVWSSDYFIALEKHLRPQFEKSTKENMLAGLDFYQPRNDEEKEQIEVAKEHFLNMTEAEWKQMADKLWDVILVEGPLSGFFDLPLAEQISEASVLGKANSSIYSKVRDWVNERLLNSNVTTLKAEVERARRKDLPVVAGVLVLASVVQLIDEILLTHGGELPAQVDNPQLAEIQERCFEIFDIGMQILIDQKSQLSPELVSAMSLAANLFSRFPQGESRRTALLEITSRALNPDAQVSDPSFNDFHKFGLRHNAQLQERLRGE